MMYGLASSILGIKTCAISCKDLFVIERTFPVCGSPSFNSNLDVLKQIYCSLGPHQVFLFFFLSPRGLEIVDGAASFIFYDNVLL